MKIKRITYTLTDVIEVELTSGKEGLIIRETDIKASLTFKTSHHPTMEAAAEELTRLHLIFRPLRPGLFDHQKVGLQENIKAAYLRDAARIINSQFLGWMEVS